MLRQRSAQRSVDPRPCPVPDGSTPSSGPADRIRRRGQMLVAFALAIFVLMGITAVVIDISWYWANSLKVQRAADAAALAGVVWLPSNAGQAYLVAREEATKNGYTTGGGVTVTPLQDPPPNLRRLKVTISAPIGTFFMKVFGINSIQATRVGKAEYILPVPMGSPQNYYGVGFLRDAVTTTTTSHNISNGDSDWQTASAAPSGGQWTSSSNFVSIQDAVANNDNTYAQTSTNDFVQQWNNFDLTTGGNPAIPSPGGNQALSIVGLEVRLSDTFLSANCANSTVKVDLSWNNGNGTSWSSQVATPNLATDNRADYTLPSVNGDTTTTAWGAHTWVRNDFTNTSFRVRLTSAIGCGGVTVNVDRLEVRVYYSMDTTTTTTTTSLADTPVVGPHGQVLPPQNFWGAMQSQGAPNIQGDAYMTKYESRSGLIPNNVDPGQDPDAQYLPDSYYNYAIEMPAGTTNGSVWIFDPGFCDTTPTAGTGEYWTVGSPNGYSSRQPISSFYDLYDTKGTPYDLNDDLIGGPVASSGNTFRRLSYDDHSIYAALGQSTNATDCTGQSWHYDVNSWNGANPPDPRPGWYRLASGLVGGKTYRLHTYSTDPNSAGDQDNATALNAFALYAEASGGTPRIYGIGAMEAYVRLPGGQASEFYLAQIDAQYAGKTMVINLWDPGDTGALSATLEILQPGTSDYVPVGFKYHATRGTADGDASNCSSGVVAASSVITNTGGHSLYNGCWLTIEVELPQGYSAPHPSSDTVTAEKGWWKIRYSMGGSSSNFSTDLTTWQVDIRGNPVHLIVP